VLDIESTQGGEPMSSARRPRRSVSRRELYKHLVGNGNVLRWEANETDRVAAAANDVFVPPDMSH
jgi:hypothetical protein